MSWDVLILKSPPSLVAIPEDFDEKRMPPLGALAEVRDRLSSLFPSMDFSDPSWGDFEHSDYSIEFNIGEDDPCISLLLHVRGEDSAMQAIALLCGQTLWRAYGPDGRVLDFSNEPARGLREWRAYRDKGVAAAVAQGKKVVLGPRINGVRFDAWEVPSEPAPQANRPW